MDDGGKNDTWNNRAATAEYEVYKGDHYETVYKYDTSVYIIFNPNQVKSATDNTGAYSKTNNNIFDETEVKSEPKVEESGKLKVGQVKTKRKPIVKKAGAKPIRVEGNPTGISFKSLSKEQQETFRDKYKDIIDVEEYFNNLTEQEKQHELDCLG